MACLRESLRVFPVESRLAKLAHADAVLPSTSFAVGPGDTLVETGKFTVAIPAGSIIMFDIWAVHMNRGWPTPQLKPLD